jgi:hypothetical protein
MKNFLFSLFAIGVAAVAAMTATTAMLNAPHRTVSPAIVAASTEVEQMAPGVADTRPAAEGATPATPGGAADHAAKPASGAAGKTAAAKEDKDDEGDKDPYEGIAPEEIPPDMQYSADSSVSFPTNI